MLCGFIFRILHLILSNSQERRDRMLQKLFHEALGTLSQESSTRCYRRTVQRWLRSSYLRIRNLILIHLLKKKRKKLIMRIARQIPKTWPLHPKFSGSWVLTLQTLTFTGLYPPNNFLGFRIKSRISSALSWWSSCPQPSGQITAAAK